MMGLREAADWEKAGEWPTMGLGLAELVIIVVEERKKEKERGFRAWENKKGIIVWGCERDRERERERERLTVKERERGVIKKLY